MAVSVHSVRRVGENYRDHVCRVFPEYYKWKHFPATRGVFRVWVVVLSFCGHYGVFPATRGDEIPFSPTFPAPLHFNIQYSEYSSQRVREGSKHGTDVGNRLIRLSYHGKVERGHLSSIPGSCSTLNLPLVCAFGE